MCFSLAGVVTLIIHVGIYWTAHAVSPLNTGSPCILTDPDFSPGAHPREMRFNEAYFSF